MNRKSEEIKEKQISEVMASIENRVRHAYNQGYEQGLKDSKQEPKIGHWEQYGNSWEDKFKCSECGKEQPKILCGERIIGHFSDYCPNCGAKMESEE